MPLPLCDRMFLGPEVPDLVAHVRSICPEHFELSEDLNLFANAWIFSTDPMKDDVRHMLVGTLLARLMTAFQGTVIMAERGMLAEVRLLARKVLEVCFRLVAVGKSEENAFVYIRSDETHRRKFLNKLKTLKSVEHTQVELEKIENLRREVDAAIQSQSIEEVGTQWFAERAGLMDLYNTAYALLSESAHVNPRDLESLIAKTPDGDIEALEYGPSPEQVPQVLLAAIETTIIALEAAFALLPGGDREALAALRSRHDVLFDAQ